MNRSLPEAASVRPVPEVLAKVPVVAKSRGHVLDLAGVMTVRTWLEAAEVASGVFRVRSQRVNCYLVRDGSALTLVDSGLPAH